MPTRLAICLQKLHFKDKIYSLGPFYTNTVLISIIVLISFIGNVLGIVLSKFVHMQTNKYYLTFTIM